LCSASRRLCSADFRFITEGVFASRGVPAATNAVGRKTGVADGDGVAETFATDGVAETFATDGAAETDATGGDLIVVGTGFALPASKAEAVALGDATAACPSCFDRAFFSRVTAAKLSAPTIIKAKKTPARTTLRGGFGELRKRTFCFGAALRWSLSGRRRCLFMDNAVSVHYRVYNAMRFHTI
jgi:hypothetical protein